ncbi:Hypothetical protein, putative [Bodo saltans]|uniref:Uncharacterized protein n=1 Tax=Bodo saltans TaxID=75058 RepID=A0A0S4IJJ7_BODSA|nr:Hypothetical protein, putative [Bodo saltans]|eukprot:CUE88005.1 Hypothetical protein, putative [Bodo saltans]
MLQRRRSNQVQLYNPAATTKLLIVPSPDVAVVTPQPSSPLVADTYPPFSSADYDVVSYVAKQFYQVAQRCGQTLHRATHHSPSSSSQRQALSAVSASTPAMKEEVLPMPEELLGA